MKIQDKDAMVKCAINNGIFMHERPQIGGTARRLMAWPMAETHKDNMSISFNLWDCKTNEIVSSLHSGALLTREGARMLGQFLIDWSDND